MSVISDYLATLGDTEKTTIGNMYNVVREMAPDAIEALSYGMPALKYKGKGLVAIMATKNFLSLYPFGAVEKLGIDLSAYECTTGSVHFSTEKRIPEELLRNIIAARLQQIEGAK